MRSGSRRVGLAGLLATVGLGACITPDATLPPPILPVPPSARLRVAVPETLNESPLAVVATLTAETNRMLATVLERTGRFVVDDAADVRLETAITAIYDEDVSESVVYRDARVFGQERRAIVEMRYRVVDGAGRTLVSGAVAGDDVEPGKRAILIPERVDLETGAYWNTTVGRATRACIDAMVRKITESA